jgi:hypothetical protein
VNVPASIVFAKVKESVDDCLRGNGTDLSLYG